MKLDSSPTATSPKLIKPGWLKPGLSKWLVGCLALGLLAGGGWTLYRQMATASPRPESRRQAQAATVERLTLAVTISANGTVQPERSVNVSPKNSGILKELLVKEGDRVQEGQILAYMDDSNLQGQLTQAQANLVSAQANLEKVVTGNRPQEIAQAQATLNSAQANLEKVVTGNRPQEIAQAQAQVQNAQATLRQAELTLSRNQQLFSSGAVSRQDLDNAQTAVDSAKAQVAQVSQALNLQRSGSRAEDVATARSQVEQAKQALSLQQSGSRPEDVTAARAQVMNAEGALQNIQAQMNDTVLRAPFSGVVTRKFADPGSFVTPTTSSSSVSSATSSSILALASTNQIVAKIPETSIPKVKLGLPVTIEPDAYPGQAFKGKVTQIATQSTVEQNVTNFEVKMSLADPQKRLQAGMNVTVKLNVGSLPEALVVPTVAIVRQDTGTGVFLAGQGDAKARFQPITTGVTVEDKTVVASGLKAGDRVLLSYPQGERPASRTPSLMPGMGGGGGGGGRRGG